MNEVNRKKTIYLGWMIRVLRVNPLKRKKRTEVVSLSFTSTLRHNVKHIVHSNSVSSCYVLLKPRTLLKPGMFCNSMKNQMFEFLNYILH